MRQRERRLRVLESWVGTKERDLEREQSERNVFYHLNLALEHHQAWNSLPLEERWRMFRNPQNVEAKELINEGMKILLDAIREEKKRRAKL